MIIKLTFCVCILIFFHLNVWLEGDDDVVALILCILICSTYSMQSLSMLYESLYVVSTNYFNCCLQLLFLVIKVSMAINYSYS